METDLKLGDRVDVSLIVTKPWESKRGFSNGLITEIDKISEWTTAYRVLFDEHSNEIPYHSLQSSGYFLNSGWNIVKHEI